MNKKEENLKEDISSSISQQESREMEDLLIEFKDSKFWPAYKKYITIRKSIAENSLCSIDPFKEPTQMARNQGIRSGLQDVEIFIDKLIDSRKKIDAIKEEEKNINEKPNTSRVTW